VTARVAAAGLFGMRELNWLSAVPANGHMIVFIKLSVIDDDPVAALVAYHLFKAHYHSPTGL